MECLQSIQKTNPSLWLTVHQLKKLKRDAHYVPSVACALGTIICRSVNAEFRKNMKKMIRRFDDSGMGREDEGDESSVGEGSEIRYVEPIRSQALNQGHQEAATRELRKCLESRLRKIIMVHEAPPKKNLNAKRAKIACNTDQGARGNTNSTHDDCDNQSQNSLVSYDFLAVSDDEERYERSLSEKSSSAATTRTAAAGFDNHNNSDLESCYDALSDVSPAPPRPQAGTNKEHGNLNEVDNDEDWLWG